MELISWPRPPDTTPHPPCPRCKRPVHPWPIGNRSMCSPKDWAHCIRNDLDLSVDGGTLDP